MIAALLLFGCGGDGDGGPPWSSDDTDVRGTPDPSLVVPPYCLPERCTALSLQSAVNVNVRDIAPDGDGSLWISAAVSGDLVLGDEVIDNASGEANAPFLVRWTPETSEVGAFALPGAGSLAGTYDLVAGAAGDALTLQHAWDDDQPTVGPWLVRVGTDGAEVWAVPFDYLDARQLRADGAGGAWVWGLALNETSILVDGNAIAVPTGTNRWLGHFDADGALVEQRFLGTFDGYDFLVLEDGTVVVQGVVRTTGGRLGDQDLPGNPERDMLLLGAVAADGVHQWSHTLLSYDDVGEPGRMFPGAFARHADGRILSTWSWGTWGGAGHANLELPDGSTAGAWQTQPMVVAMQHDGSMDWAAVARWPTEMAIGPGGVIYTLTNVGEAFATHPEGPQLGAFGFEYPAVEHVWLTDVATDDGVLYLAGELTFAATWGAVTVGEHPDIGDTGRSAFVYAVQVTR